MKKGLFLQNWEIAAVYDVINFVRIEGHFELETQEIEVFEKLAQHIEEVAEEYEKSIKSE
jgi:hypothetical protein